MRGAQIAGQNPFTAALGVLVVLTRHPAGRIGGRTARDRKPFYLGGQFVIEPAPITSAPASQAVAIVAEPAKAAVVQAVGVRAAGSGLDRLLAGTGAAR
ncbi:hypothetical protein ACM614_26755 [Streptomyces sp. 12297]